MISACTQFLSKLDASNYNTTSYENSTDSSSGHHSYVEATIDLPKLFNKNLFPFLYANTSSLHPFQTTNETLNFMSSMCNNLTMSTGKIILRSFKNTDYDVRSSQNTFEILQVTYSLKVGLPNVKSN